VSFNRAFAGVKPALTALALVIGSAAMVPVHANPDLVAGWLAACLDETAPRSQRLTDCTQVIDAQDVDADDRADALLARGQLHEATGDLSAAQADYAKAAEIDPENDQAHFLLGNVQETLGLFEQALSSYDAAIRINPEHDDAYNNRGRVLEELGQYEQAIDSFTASIRIDPEDPAPYYNRGTVWLTLDDFSKALEDFEKAIALGLKDADLLASRGRAHEGLGNIEAARADYKAALADDPANDGAIDGLKRLPQ